MSRRFGRNQRRRARAEIAQLEQKVADLSSAMEMDRALLRQQTQKIGALRGQLENVARIMGTNFIGLEPKLLDFSRSIRSDPFRYPVDGGDVLVHVMKSRVTVCRDRPDYMIHFRVDLASEAAGYAISECALRDAPEDYIVRLISEEIAHTLVRELRKKNGRS